MRNSRRRTRDAFDVSNRRLRFYSLSSSRVIPLSISRRRSALSEFEDRRLYHPEGVQAPARSFVSPRHRIKAIDRVYTKPRFYSPSALTFHTGPVKSQTRATLAFSDPKRTLICVRRQIRREVIHALKFSGRNGARHYRRTPYSSISCRG